MKNPWRSKPAVRAALAATVVGGIAAGGYFAVAEPAGSPAAAPGATQSTHDDAKPAPAFTNAAAGACVTWDPTKDRGISNFHEVDCAEKHRFEVASKEDLAIYPSSEFGPNAEPASVKRQGELREELCSGPTMEYLKGKLDPEGRYSIASILPPPPAWQAGDRTMLCGLQSPGQDGQPILTRGKVTEQDQAQVAQPGQCVRLGPNGSPAIVDCGEDHSFEVTSIEDLRAPFPQGNPSQEDQDKFLSGRCPDAAREYLGGDDALYNSTLEPFWTTIPMNSWAGGSHSTNCALFKGNDDGSMATLKGTAKDKFTIDGKNPPPQPPRNPLRGDQPKKP